MNELTKAEVQRLIAEKLKELGLTRLSGMFALEHNVPRGTHKAVTESVDADTLDGHHASDFAAANHTHAGMLTGEYDADFKSLCISTD